MVMMSHDVDSQTTSKVIRRTHLQRSAADAVAVGSVETLAGYCLFLQALRTSPLRGCQLPGHDRAMCHPTEFNRHGEL